MEKMNKVGKNAVVAISAAGFAVLVTCGAFAAGERAQADDGSVANGSVIGHVVDPGHAISVETWQPGPGGNSYTYPGKVTPFAFTSSIDGTFDGHVTRQYGPVAGLPVVAGCSGKVVERVPFHVSYDGKDFDTFYVSLRCDDGSYIGYSGIGK